MKLYLVDKTAVLGNSFLHRVTPESKFLSFLVLLAGVVVTEQLQLLLFLLIFFSVMLISVGLELKAQALFLIYPLFFGFVFGRILLGITGWDLIIILLRASTAVYCVLLFISTTTYINIFAVLGRFLPQVLVDIMLLTYRAFFIIAGYAQETLVAVKLKGGFKYVGVKRSLKNIAEILGFILLKSLDLNERSYRVLLLRGYGEGIKTFQKKQFFKLKDLIPLLCSISVFLLAVLW